MPLETDEPTVSVSVDEAPEFTELGANAPDTPQIVQVGVVQRDLADGDDEKRFRPAGFELEQPPRLGAEPHVDAENDGTKQQARRDLTPEGYGRALDAANRRARADARKR